MANLEDRESVTNSPYKGRREHKWNEVHIHQTWSRRFGQISWCF